LIIKHQSLLKKKNASPIFPGGAIFPPPPTKWNPVEHSVVLWFLFVIGSALTYLQLFQECATPPHVQIHHCTWLKFTRPSPALVLLVTNAEVRRPGYEATYGSLQSTRTIHDIALMQMLAYRQYFRTEMETPGICMQCSLLTEYVFISAGWWQQNICMDHVRQIRQRVVV